MVQSRKDVLNGWKEIAAYLGRDPRTVERWEKQRSLPVRRLPGGGRATVYALVPELDAWLASGSREPEGQVAASEPIELAPASEPDPLTLTEGERPARDDSPPAVLTSSARVAFPPGVAAPPRTLRQNLVSRWVWALGLLIALCGGVAVLRFRGRNEAQAGEWTRGRSHTLVPTSAVPGVEALYLRGTYQTEQRTPESLRRAQEAFRKAISQDPGYAPAYAGLGKTFLLLREYATMPDAEAYPEASRAAQAALARDPDLPQAHAVLGFIRFFWEWHPDEADLEFQRALRADPDFALAHHWYGSVLIHEGRFKEGLRELEAAQRLEPSSAAILTTRTLALGLAGRSTEALDLLEEAVIADPGGQPRNPATMHAVLGILSLLPPRNLPRYLSESLVAAQLRQDLHGVETLNKAIAVYHRSGENAMWQTLLESERRHQAGGRPSYALARLEAETGARDQALKDLADLYARHDPALIGLAIDPLLAPLHPEPRYRQLCAAMRLPVSDLP